MKTTNFFLLPFIAFFMMSFTPENENDDGYQIGDTAEDFSLKNIDREMVSLNNIKDAKGFIVIFTCNHCPFSVAYENRIIELHKKFAPLGFPVVAINPNDSKKQPQDSFEGMRQRAKEKRFPFYYLHDPTQEIAKKYGAKRTPHVYVLSKKDTQLQVEYIGAIDDNVKNERKATKTYVKDAVESLISNKKIETKTTKAIGCSIKWRKA